MTTPPPTQRIIWSRALADWCTPPNLRELALRRPDSYVGSMLAGWVNRGRVLSYCDRHPRPWNTLAWVIGRRLDDTPDRAAALRICDAGDSQHCAHAKLLLRAAGMGSQRFDSLAELQRDPRSMNVRQLTEQAGAASRFIRELVSTFGPDAVNQLDWREPKEVRDRIEEEFAAQLKRYGPTKIEQRALERGRRTLERFDEDLVVPVYLVRNWLHLGGAPVGLSLFTSTATAELLRQTSGMPAVSPETIKQEIHSCGLKRPLTTGEMQSPNCGLVVRSARRLPDGKTVLDPCGLVVGEFPQNWKRPSPEQHDHTET